ncbi:MAG: succinate--CoA ligase subunit beta [Thermofilaceae archaeon]
MILYEFEAKSIIETYGIPTEKSIVVDKRRLHLLGERISDLQPPYVVKAQVRGWGRGKAGLIVSANSVDEAVKAAEKLFNSRFAGKPINYVMLSEHVNVREELYVSMMLTDSPPGTLILASKHGGIEVEDLAIREGALLKLHVDPFEGLREYHIRRVAKHLKLNFEKLSSILKGMYKAVWDYSLLLLEINPLAVTDNGVIAIDRKAVVDSDSENQKLSEFISRYREDLSEIERQAALQGFSLVEMDGDVAIIGNGAGLTMATLDEVSDVEVKPAFFLDLGGGASAENIAKALKLVLAKPGLKTILVNILGGITRCDEVAKGLVTAFRESGSDVKLVVRLSGHMEEEGRKVLEEAGIRSYERLEEAIKEVVH